MSDLNSTSRGEESDGPGLCYVTSHGQQIGACDGHVLWDHRKGEKSVLPRKEY